MIEAKMPKDIRRFKGKAIGPFTLRQVICVIVAAVLAAAVYFLLKDTQISSDMRGFIMFAAAVIPLLFITEPSGMKMEVYLRDVVYKSFLFPRKRLTGSDLTPKPEPKKQEEIKKINDEYKKNIAKHPELKMYE